MLQSIVFLCFLDWCISRPILHKDKTGTKLDVLEYLQHYGYVGYTRRVLNQRSHKQFTKTNSTTNRRKELLKQSLKVFQKTWNLTVTGTLTQETVKLMKTPRCGVTDIRLPSARDRTGNLTVYSADTLLHLTNKNWYKYAEDFPWNTNKLAYNIVNYPQHTAITKKRVDHTVAKAFKTWQELSGLSIERTYSSFAKFPVLDIGFYAGKHFDSYAFDGPGNIFAHAFFPNVGAIHFDDDEYWTLNSEEGVNLLHVAVHEAGHALGLDHSKKENTIMYPFYSGYDPKFHLDIEDVVRIQKLYGPPRNGVMLTNYAYVEDKRFCVNYTFDAVLSISEQSKLRTYGFLGIEYVELSTKTTDEPRLIADDWVGVPNNVDCALTWHEQFECAMDSQTGVLKRGSAARKTTTFLFRGLFYWKLNGRGVSEDDYYPKMIKDGWGDLPTPLDAAFEWIDGLTYFFKGDSFYKYYPDAGIVAGPFPTSSGWIGFPPHIDAAHVDDESNRYIFFEGKFSKLLPKTKWIQDGYPQSIRDVWLQKMICSKEHRHVTDA